MGVLACGQRNQVDKAWPLEAGVDEAGRGPLIGSVVAAAVILPPQFDIKGLTDSKKMSARQREHAFERIQAEAVAWAIAEATASEIDTLNILQANLLAMQRAVDALPIAPTRVFIDGNRCPNLAQPAQAIVQGDALIPAISAASVLAKVWRDRQMDELAKIYPAYGFDQHKGYPTAAHRAAIQREGVLPLHRRSFKPVAQALAQQDQQINLSLTSSSGELDEAVQDVHALRLP